jgi:predicted ABC-type transport system involved in lysophospholipase L1 biosynthesis ATPase subunit
LEKRSLETSIPKVEADMSLFSKPANGNGNGKEPIIDLCDVHKYYKTAIGDFHALNSIDLQINPAEFVSIIGKSGSGKSTLLNMITGIDRPTSGEVYVNGTAVHTMSENRMARWRGKNMGIVFQFFQLLPTISVIKNIMLPMDFCRTYPMRQREKRALEFMNISAMSPAILIRCTLCGCSRTSMMAPHRLALPMS